MNSFRVFAAVIIAVGMSLWAPLTSAHAEKPSPEENHGQCVSGSEKPDGAGGRSEAAKDGCPTPDPGPDSCQESGTATINEDQDTATVTGTGSGSPGSSVTCTTDIEVAQGDTISADYVFAEGTDPCGGGVPRMYVEIDGQYYNTFDDNPNECEATTTTLVLPVSGTVTEVGLIYDRGDYGSVTYSNIQIGDTALDL